MQNKKLSAVEAITNTVSGLVISFIIQIIIYPFLVSFVRGYIVRRFFNRLKEKREDAE